MGHGSRTTILFALAANALIASAKLAGGVIGGSSALLAEAAHSFADTTNQVLLLVSLKLGSARADEEHPFGHGKERFFWAFVVAVSIFVAGGVFSVGEGIFALLGDPREGSLLVTLGVLMFALVAEAVALLRAVVQLRKDAKHEGEPFFTYVRASKDPTPKVVLFEDSAAVTGVLIAVSGVLTAHFTGNHAWDAAAAIAIGALLIVTGLELGRETRGLLIGEAADEEERRALRAAIESHDDVDRLVELLTMHMGPRSVLVNARVEFVPGVDVGQLEEIVTELGQRMRDAVPAARTIFVDPAPRAAAERR